jgi:divalent metal cation (Fe/Co/Zn/Cd) transporter
VLIGLVLVRAGYPDADSIAALLVAGLAMFSAGRLMNDSVNALMDRVAPGREVRYASALLVQLDPATAPLQARQLAERLCAEHVEITDVEVLDGR